MNPAVASAQVFRFGLFEADVAQGTLTRRGVRVKIQEQPFRTLVCLIERAGDVVTREELRQKLWPEGTYVDFDGSLNAILKKLRTAIDDDSDNPRFIETVPRRGYRFIAPVFADVRPRAKQPQFPAESTGPRQQNISSGQEAAKTPPNSRHSNRLAMALAMASLILLILLAIRLRHSKKNVSVMEVAPQGSVAVIPFSNAGAGEAFDYLRFALASDIVTDLTYVRSLSVRPFESMTKYAVDPKDPETVGREMKVAYVLSGDFATEDGKLKVTTQLTRISDAHVLWRDSISVTEGKLVRLHELLAERLQHGVITTIGAREVAAGIPVPRDPHAFELYLHSVAVPRDPEPNKAAILTLNESLSADPGYAPAWDELGWRYYLDAAYSDGGEKAYQNSMSASARAAALDPNGKYNWIPVAVEHGELREGYDEAQRLLLRRPDLSEAHFEIAYVYRYAGLLDDSARECEAALRIDPGNSEFRSCAKVFMYKGDYRRAQRFVELDGSSGWSVRQQMHFALRQRNYSSALTLGTLAVASGYKDSEIVVAKLLHKSAATLDSIVRREEAYAASEIDPEEKFEVAAMLSFAGETEPAMRLLQTAVEKNYCATPMLDSDPLLAKLRLRQDYQDLRVRSAACQQRFTDYIRSGQ